MDIGINNLHIDILNLNITEEDEECMICKEGLNCYPCYTLPECQHKYHTHCLISWFRNGDSRCPYCGNKGINNKSEDFPKYRHSRFYNIGSYEHQYLTDIRKFSNLKKNQSNPIAIKLKKEFDRLKQLECDLKEHNKEYAKFKLKIKTDNVNYVKTRKDMRDFRSNRWKILKKINEEKFKLVNNSYIVPLIIPNPIDLY